MHAVWSKILDDDFIHAYTYGIVIKGVDGIERRVYPRLFTYSADYPEKYVIGIVFLVELVLIIDSSGCFLQRSETKVSAHAHAVLSQNRNSIVLVFDEMSWSVSHNSGPMSPQKLALLARQFTVWRSPSAVLQSKIYSRHFRVYQRK